MDCADRRIGSSYPSIILLDLPVTIFICVHLSVTLSIYVRVETELYSLAL